MGISVVKDTDGREFYRVFRAWNNLHRQVYVPFGENPNESRKTAEKLDRSLAKAQLEFRQQWRSSFLSLQKSNGHIKHLEYRVLKRKGRKPAPELRVRLPALGNKKAFQKTFSISEYGFDKAYTLAVDALIKHFKYKNKDGAKRFFMEAKEYYLTNYDHSCADVVSLFDPETYSSPSIEDESEDSIELLQA